MIKRCPVAFNLEDPLQAKLYKHTKQYTNYSAYIKSLVQRDMEGGRQEPMFKGEEKELDRGLLQGFI